VRFPGGTRPDGLPVAVSDPARLAAVRTTDLLDTGPEPVFDDLAGLAAGLTGCDRAFITVVDESRSFWKSCVGVDADAVADRQNPVEESFCYFLVGLADRFAVTDAATDPRTRDHPSVGPMKIGAWAGHPILAEGGQVLGSLCVIDEQPHDWSAAELTSLATLARAVSNEINLRTSLARTRAAHQASLALARSLQESLLPPVLASVAGVRAAALYQPATGGTVLGDFYDLFHARGPWWCAVLGDVCGKGVEAAKITALARYTVRAEGTQHLSPATVLRRLNTALLDQRTSRRFLTAVHITFRATRGRVSGRLCLGGHPPGLIRRADGQVHELGRIGTMLGMFPEVDLADVRFRLAPGDTLLLYTDGATEARTPATPTEPAGQLFGEQRLAAALAECDDRSAQEIIDHVARAISRFNGGWAGDDTALLALQVPPVATTAQ
jgi:serine phosphatase RsbU (regulator of sigma subunit)